MAAVNAESGGSIATARGNATHLPVCLACPRKWHVEEQSTATVHVVELGLRHTFHVDDGKDQLAFGNRLFQLEALVVASSPTLLQCFAIRVHLEASWEIGSLTSCKTHFDSGFVAFSGSGTVRPHLVPHASARCAVRAEDVTGRRLHRGTWDMKCLDEHVRPDGHAQGYVDVQTPDRLDKPELLTTLGIPCSARESSAKTPPVPHLPRKTP